MNFPAGSSESKGPAVLTGIGLVLASKTKFVLSLKDVFNFAIVDDWSVGSEYPYGP